jgi:hypothetical protein
MEPSPVPQIPKNSSVARHNSVHAKQAPFKVQENNPEVEMTYGKQELLVIFCQSPQR